MRVADTRTRRHQRLHELLAANGRLGVEDLARQLAVTPMTIRRDLDAMQAGGLLLRVHGGCVLQAPFVQELSFSEKARQHRTEKQAIARAAAALLPPAASVYLDTGTTAALVARLLAPGARRRVFTNNLRVAMDLLGRRDVDVFVYGGCLASQSPDLVGDLAAPRILEFRTDWAVVGADAIDPATGEIFAADLATAVLSRAAQRQARRVLVVADSSKFGRHGQAVTARLGRGMILVTDRGTPPPVRRQLGRRGARVVYA